MDSLINKALNLDSLSLEEAVTLYKEAPLSLLISTADKIRYIHNPQKRVSWQIDRNVNYSNVCISGCLFCNFHCKIHETSKIVESSFEEYKKKIIELKKLGGNQLLLQGGLHPSRGIEYYEDLFKTLKEIEPSLKLNALGPPEIAHISKISSLTYRQTLERLKDCGLSTLPGAGAEILSDRVRKKISPGKPSAREWCEVMKEAHQMGFSTTATMVYGSIETIEEKMNHLIIIRDIQDQKPENAVGFRAFIPWPMQLNGTKLGDIIKRGKLSGCSNNGINEYLRIVSLSRIILNNIPHIQASWLTTGVRAAKMALHSGADDMGSIMIEENVVASTGIKNKLGEENMIRTILEAGFEPWLRDQHYHPL